MHFFSFYFLTWTYIKGCICFDSIGLHSWMELPIVPLLVSPLYPAWGWLGSQKCMPTPGSLLAAGVEGKPLWEEATQQWWGVVLGGLSGQTLEVSFG